MRKVKKIGTDKELKKINLCSVSGYKRERSSVITSPAFENIRSAGTLVAKICSNFIAKCFKLLILGVEDQNSIGFVKFGHSCKYSNSLISTFYCDLFSLSIFFGLPKRSSLWLSQPTKAKCSLNR
jgi:hypothetical protein